jgi:hypothetical protein
MKNLLMIIMMIALIAIITYFYFRLRSMIRNAPGANNRMTTKELIKNWQNNKAKDAEYKNNLRKQAAKEAKPIIEKILVDKYKNEAIKEATADKSTQFKEKMKEGLGIDFDKATSQQSMDRMLGRNTPGTEQYVEHTDIFNKEKIAGYATHGTIDSDKIRNSAGSLRWGEGMREGLKSTHDFNGVQKAIKKDGERVEYIDPRTQTKKQNPPQRP